MVRSQFHKHSSVRLNFQTGKVVVLELGSKGKLHAPVEQADFILRESAELIQLAVVRLQRHGKARVIAVADRAISNSPDDGLRISQVKRVLEVDVENVLMIGK